MFLSQNSEFLSKDLRNLRRELGVHFGLVILSEICVFAVPDISSGYKSVKKRNFAISDKNVGKP